MDAAPRSVDAAPGCHVQVNASRCCNDERCALYIRNFLTSERLPTGLSTALPQIRWIVGGKICPVSIGGADLGHRDREGKRHLPVSTLPRVPTVPHVHSKEVPIGITMMCLEEGCP